MLLLNARIRNSEGEDQMVGASAQAEQTLLRMITAAWVSQAIYVAAKLGIADLLESGPRSSENLAHATGVHPHALYRVLRALASVGIFIEMDEKEFALSSLAEPLRTAVSGSVPPYAIMMASEWV